MAGRYWIVLLASGCADFAGIGDPGPLQPDAREVPCLVGGIDLCLFARPQSALSIDVDLKIDTTRDCNLVVYAPPAPSVCVIYASDIQINATISAIGSRSLVLAASNSIVVTGSVDVSAYLALGNTPAGSNDPSCTYTSSMGYGAPAGGSFAGKGGNGGNGVGGSGSQQGGIAGPAVYRPENVRGGCPGGGRAGGGVWLAAGTEVRVSASGRVLANGAGARGGNDFGSSGGGSGGMIRIAAPRISLAGIITANGGGGGEGTDSNGTNNVAANGADGTIGTTRAMGGGGTSSTAGDGGAGGAGSSLDGVNGTNATGTIEATGGGGGGGAGFVHLVSDSIENTATVSPPPSI